MVSNCGLLLGCPLYKTNFPVGRSAQRQQVTLVTELITRLSCLFMQCLVTNAQPMKVVQSNKPAGDTCEEARGGGGGAKVTIQMFPELFFGQKSRRTFLVPVSDSHTSIQFVKQFWRRTMSPRDYCHSQPRYYRITVRQSDSWCCPDNYSAAWISVEKLH